MIDATKLLDQFLGAGSGGRAREAIEQLGTQFGVLNRDPQGSQRPGTSVPTTRRDAPAAAGGNDLLGRAQEILGGGGGFGGGAAAAAIAGLLLGSKSGRKLAMNAAQLGAMAVLGGLAYKAYTNYRDGRPILGGPAAADVGSVTPATLPGAPAPDDHAMLLLRAMIAAASSDGLIDANERQQLVSALGHAGMGAEERQFLDAELARPWSPAQLASSTTTPEMRSEIYLASVLAIDCDTEAERAYIRYLAATLGLDQKLVEHLDATADAAKAQSKAA